MNGKIAFVAALALCVPAMAEARKEPSVWVKCDGYAKPEPGGVKLVKGLAALSTLGIFGIPESFSPAGRATGPIGVRACEIALADPVLDEGRWLRRVRLNQALAIHQLEDKNDEGALAALDAAVAAAGPSASNPMYARSTGISLDLLRSIVLLRMGRNDDAVAAARRASAARPHSARVQTFALAMMGFDGRADKDIVALGEKLQALDPSNESMLAALYLRGRRYDAAWRLLGAQREAAKAAAKAPGTTMKELLDGSGFMAAFAAARSGHAEIAREILDEEKAERAKLVEILGNLKLSTAKEGEPQTPLAEQLAAPVEAWRPVIDAAGLVAAGDGRAAQAALVASDRTAATPLLADLIEDIRAIVPAPERKGIVAIDPAAMRAKLSEGREKRIERLGGGDLFDMLPEPEDEKQLNSFSRQAGWGLKPTGFKHKTLDNGRVRIEFVGSSSSALAVEEMTLLRGATLAKEAGKPGFIIEQRKDYTRWMQSTLYGTPMGPRVLAGYKTEIEVRFTDDLADPRVQPAAQLQDALGAIYIRPRS